MTPKLDHVPGVIWDIPSWIWDMVNFMECPPRQKHDAFASSWMVQNHQVAWWFCIKLLDAKTSC
jgi:hypothetical protein